MLHVQYKFEKLEGIGRTVRSALDTSLEFKEKQWEKV